MTTKSKIEYYIGVNLSNDLNSYITNYISAVTAWIENYTGKSFTATSGTKKYFGLGSSDLIVDSFVTGSITAITDDSGNSYSVSDFFTTPFNREEGSVISLKNGTFKRGAIISVTANFGVGVAVPADISLVATKLVGGILAKSIDGGKISQSKLGDTDVTFEKIDEQAEVM